MIAAHRMKRLLICLVPWMAMTAAAQQVDVPQQVEVVYSNIGPAEAWRMGDECYVAPSVITSWHWPYTINGSDATIQAEGRTLKVQTKIVHERVLFPLRAMVEQLGAICRWRTNDELDVLGQVRIVALKNGVLSIDSTISDKPHVFSLTEPGRLVIELRGMTLGAQAADGLPDSVRVSQTTSDTVRVVYQSDSVPRVETNSDDPTRQFQYSVNFTKSVPVRTGIPDLVPNSDQTQLPNTRATVSTNGQTIAQSPVISSENGESVAMTVPLSTQPPDSVRSRRIDLFTFEVTIPGAAFSNDFRPPQSSSIESITTRQLSDAAVLRIHLNRPSGLEVSTSDHAVNIFVEKASAEGSLSGRTIVIDPGHGGQDSGTRSPDGSCEEKNLTLSIGTDVAQDLAAAGANVIMTRTSDVFIPLKERPSLANRNDAVVFVSIHVNSNALLDSRRSGTTTYFHAHDSQGEALGDCIEDEIAQISGIPRLGVVSDYSRFPRTGMAVLRYSKMPAVLIETGYITNPTDRSKLCSEEFQQSLARAIVRGIRLYLGNAGKEISK